MKKMVKKLTSAAMAVVMVMGMSVSASAGTNGDTCYHTTLTAAIEAPFVEEYVGVCLEHSNCKLYQKIGILRQRCAYCGTIVSETDYRISGYVHKTS